MRARGPSGRSAGRIRQRVHPAKKGSWVVLTSGGVDGQNRVRRSRRVSTPWGRSMAARYRTIDRRGTGDCDDFARTSGTTSSGLIVARPHAAWWPWWRRCSAIGAGRLFPRRRWDEFVSHEHCHKVRRGRGADSGSGLVEQPFDLPRRYAQTYCDFALTQPVSGEKRGLELA